MTTLLWLILALAFWILCFLLERWQRERMRKLNDSIRKLTEMPIEEWVKEHRPEWIKWTNKDEK